jgi:hypothetical protein
MYQTRTALDVYFASCINYCIVLAPYVGEGIPLAVTKDIYLSEFYSLFTIERT